MTLKLNSKVLKQEVVGYLKERRGFVNHIYGEELDFDETELYDVKIWKRETKEKDDDHILRVFAPRIEHETLSDDLRIYVYTDETDTEILGIEIELD